jgi:hypothetical protein
MNNAPTMFHPTKARYTIVLGEYASQNSSVLSQLKIAQKFCA